jgi:hypothetical protein
MVFGGNGGQGPLRHWNLWQIRFFCHPERRAGSQVLEKARFFVSLRMTFLVRLRSCQSFQNMKGPTQVPAPQEAKLRVRPQDHGAGFFSDDNGGHVFIVAEGAKCASTGGTGGALSLGGKHTGGSSSSWACGPPTHYEKIDSPLTPTLFPRQRVERGIRKFLSNFSKQDLYQKMMRKAGGAWLCRPAVSG